MPVNKLINRNDRYYIAMYSAHASILENLIGKRGIIEKLLVDAGGLKAPKGSYKSKAIFDGYTPVTNKTLHAKVIYLDKLKTLSLWTGNLREQTLNRQANIVITKKISDRHGNATRKWFDSASQKEHLIVNISQNKVCKVGFSKTIWSSFKANLEKVTDSSLSLYAFSPWGSSKFVHEAAAHLGDKLINISLYTRAASKEENLWIDTKIDDQYGDLRILRYIRKDVSSFPHYKCVFITQKDGKKEKLIWAYVGSANLTEAAFFKRSNVEFAVFFDKIRSGSEISRIFNELKRPINWEVRIHGKHKVGLRDESNQEFDEEMDVQDNFEIRRLSKYLCEELKKKKMQTKLEDSYRKGKPLRINKCIIEVVGVLEGMFDLHVRCNPYSFSLPIKRLNNGQIYSEGNGKQLMCDLLERPSAVSQGNNVKSQNGTETTGARYDNLFRNIRFPMEHVILDKKFFAKKQAIIRQLSCCRESLSEVDRHLVGMWKQILNQMEQQ